MLSMTTDYAISTGNPEPYLKRIADAGFTHIHWCHHWNTDFLYGPAEIHQLAKWLKHFHLRLNDLHASAGREKGWGSAHEWERLAGVELVKNRIDMTAELGADVVVIHLPMEPQDPEERKAFWTRMEKTFDELEPHAHKRGVRLALENMTSDNYDTLRKALALKGPDFLGICYDCGHGNIVQPPEISRMWMEAHADRLIAIHLHDNDGKADLHRVPFNGTVDWEWVSGIIAKSPYRKAVNLESSIRNSGLSDEKEFLSECLAAAQRIEALIAAAREA